MDQKVLALPYPIAQSLVSWFALHARELPWREGCDPYAIWLSEIILQQTRVDQGLQYYLRFLERFPTVTDLARASEDEVLRLWQGLGYYSRAYHLHKAAQIIEQKHHGQFPSDYKTIQSLPGIGAYTAGAIASFAFDQPYPAVDGNVLRVISRLLASDLPIDTPAGQKLCTQAVEELLESKLSPRILGQALIELGALICTPKSPQCDQCPIQAQCQVAGLPRATELPLKRGKLKIRTRYLNFVCCEYERQILIGKRDRNDIWRGLYQLPLIESEVPIHREEIAEQLQALLHLSETPSLHSPQNQRHKLSHQQLFITIYQTELLAPPHPLPKALQWVASSELEHYAFPIPLKRFLEDRGV